jgi:hypothetical protein
LELASVAAGLVSAGIPQPLVDELVASYVETKRRHYLGDHRPQEVEGGRFAECAFRILQHETSGGYTPIGKALPSTPELLRKLENATGHPESVRIHIPRTLQLIYDIRNKRDAAHLGDGIDPNLQDATLVMANMDWVMAELVRLHHGVGADAAQAIIDDLVTKEVPVVQEIDGQPVILSQLQPRDQALLMLYRAGAKGASLEDLAKDLRVSRKADLKRRLMRLDEGRLALLHPASNRFYITVIGVRDVEERRLARP